MCLAWNYYYRIDAMAPWGNWGVTLRGLFIYAGQHWRDFARVKSDFSIALSCNCGCQLQLTSNIHWLPWRKYLREQNLLALRPRRVLHLDPFLTCFRPFRRATLWLHEYNSSERFSTQHRQVLHPKALIKQVWR